MTKTKIRFFHLADCHIGAWREPKMRELNISAFSSAVDLIVSKNKINSIDFVLISGDLFNSAIPNIDSLKIVIKKLKELSVHKIPVYGIAGSHDFSSSGKTMLEVLEEAGLFINVMKGKVTDEGKLVLDFTEDSSGALITGIIGKKGSLDKKYYEILDYSNLNDNENIKIFLFHSAITEYLPLDLADVDSLPLSLLPKNLDYYAGGHIHYRLNEEPDKYGKIIFPGPTFPNSFKELSELRDGSIVYTEIDVLTRKINSEFILLENNILFINYCVDGKTAVEVRDFLKDKLNKDLANKIILIKLYGKLVEGTSFDIHFNEIYDFAYMKGAYCIIKNTSKLNVPEFTQMNSEIEELESIETNIISEHISQSNLKTLERNSIDDETQKAIIDKLMISLISEKKDGETTQDFDQRIFDDFLNTTRKND